MFAPIIASVHKTNTDSRSSPDDTVTFTPVSDLDARLSPPGAQTSSDDGTPSDAQTSHADTAPSDAQTKHEGMTPPDAQTSHEDMTKHDGATPPDAQTSHDDTTRAQSPEVVKKLSLSKPSAPKSPPEPDPTTAAESIEGIGSISHTSSGDGTSSNGTPPDLGPPIRQNDSAQGSGEPFEASQKQPPTKPPSSNAPPVTREPPPDPAPLPSSPKGIEHTDNVAPIPR